MKLLKQTRFQYGQNRKNKQKDLKKNRDINPNLNEKQ